MTTKAPKKSGSRPRRRQPKPKAPKKKAPTQPPQEELGELVQVGRADILEVQLAESRYQEALAKAEVARRDMTAVQARLGAKYGEGGKYVIVSPVDEQGRVRRVLRSEMPEDQG